MKKVADILFLLATFSFRTSYLEKAEIYGRAGHMLFPNDKRISAIYAYILIQRGEFEKAAEILRDESLQTANSEYLRVRLALLTSQPSTDVVAPMKRYLAIY